MFDSKQYSVVFVGVGVVAVVMVVVDDDVDKLWWWANFWWAIWMLEEWYEWNTNRGNEIKCNKMFLKMYKNICFIYKTIRTQEWLALKLFSLKTIFFFLYFNVNCSWFTKLWIKMFMIDNLSQISVGRVGERERAYAFAPWYVLVNDA